MLSLIPVQLILNPTVVVDLGVKLVEVEEDVVLVVVVVEVVVDVVVVVVVVAGVVVIGVVVVGSGIQNNTSESKLSSKLHNSFSQ